VQMVVDKYPRLDECKTYFITGKWLPEHNFTSYRWGHHKMANGESLQIIGQSRGKQF
jgi:hypothetical protein